MSTNWDEIVKRNPAGFIFLQTAGSVVVSGPIKSIEINKETNEVVIEVHWVIYTKLTEKTLTNPWIIYCDSPFVITRFSKFDFPYTIQQTKERGDVVVFDSFSDKKKGTLRKFFYVTFSEIIDTSSIEGFKRRILKENC